MSHKQKSSKLFWAHFCLTALLLFMAALLIRRALKLKRVIERERGEGGTDIKRERAQESDDQTIVNER